MRRLAHASLVYLLLVLVLFVAMLIGEQHLMRSGQQPLAISIQPQLDLADEADDSTPLQSLPLTEALAARVETLWSVELTAQQLSEHPGFVDLSAEEQGVVQAELAKRHYQARQFKQVIELLEPLTPVQRLQQEVQFAFAFALSKSGHKEAAIDAYRELVVARPNARAATLNLAFLLKKAGQYEQALPVFEQAVAISSGRLKAKAFAGMASINQQIGNHQAAVDAYQKSLEYKPDAAGVWILLAKSMAAAGSPYAEVIDTFDKGIALQPDNFSYYQDKARLQLANFDYDAMLLTLDKALPLSDSPQVYELKAWAYLERGDRSQARKYLIKISRHPVSKSFRKRVSLMRLYLDKHYRQLTDQLKQQKKLPDALRYLRGLAYRKSGYFNSALKDFNKLADKPDYQWRVRTQVVRITRSRRQYEQALEQFAQLQQHNPRAAFTWFESALTNESLGQTKPGLSDINRALSLQPDNNVYLLAKSRLMHLAGETSAALRLVGKIEQQKPNYVRALKLKARLLAEIQDKDALEATYQRILSIRREDYETQLKLAALWLEENKSDQARQLLEQLLQDQSHNTQARFMLSKVYYNQGLMKQSLTELEKLLKLDANHLKAVALRDDLMALTGRIGRKEP